MKKRTTSQKKKRIEQLTDWIDNYEKQLFRLENIKDIIPKEVEECEKSIEDFRLLANEHPEGIPQYFNNKLLEQKNFHNISEAENYIYNTVHPAINKLYYANAFLNALAKRAYLQIELMQDYTDKIIELKNKITKHQKSLNKLKETKAYSSQKLLKTFNTKSDFINILTSIEKKINSLKGILRTHLLNLNMNKECKRILAQINNGTYDYGDRIIDFSSLEYKLWKNRFVFSSKQELILKRKSWIKSSIKKIRKEEERLKKVSLKYEKYLLESGSEGEKAIRYYLSEKKIHFVEQKRFDSCKNKVSLPFDFFIEVNNILIEFDGAQHFMPIDLFGGKEAFKQRVINDNIKTNWAKSNNYNLHRIKYDEMENINTILDEIFNIIN